MNIRRRWHINLFATLLLSALSMNHALGQGVLANGWTYTGTIALVGGSDTWTFSATKGDSIIIRVGRITSTNNFTSHTVV